MKGFSTVILTVGLALLVGCGKRGTHTDQFELVIGSRGHTAGKFNRPRGIFYDEPRKLLHVVDWDGRIQSFTKEGAFRGSWIMPKVEKGKPEDLCVTPEGTILVTDTHYSRILEFTVTGKVLNEFGSYGHGYGEFIYPVGICMDKDGNIYVSEYGDNNRIQKFDRKGKFIMDMGNYGQKPGEFVRPSGIAIGPDNNLYVTDGVNHRVQVFTLDGKFLKVIGKQGTEPGDLRYPYDIVFRGDQMLVLEFGNQRVQQLKMDGTPVKMFGRGGSGDGEFASPWRFCVAGEDVYVSDTNNFRVVKLKGF